MSLAPQDIIDFGAEAHSFTSIVPIESRQNLVLLRARASPPSASARRASARVGARRRRAAGAEPVVAMRAE